MEILIDDTRTKCVVNPDQTPILVVRYNGVWEHFDLITPISKIGLN